MEPLDELEVEDVVNYGAWHGQWLPDAQQQPAEVGERQPRRRDVVLEDKGLVIKLAVIAACWLKSHSC